MGPSSATVHLHDDGSATLVTAGVEIGSGSMAQGLPQIVAAQLGIPPGKVVVRQADTDASGLDMGVGGGRTTVSLGAASLEACAAVRGQLLEAASEMLQTPAEGLVLRGGRVEIAASPGAGVGLPEVVARLQSTRGPVAGHGAFTAPGEPSLPGCAAGHFIEAIDIPVHAVHEAEVAVDPDTGHVEVLAYRAAQDVGLALNPRAVRGQVQGGVVQGLGYALHEEASLDARGAILQTGFETYRIPGALDAPAVETILHEGGPSLGPLGIKGAGEAPILNVPAAIACAVANATGAAVASLPLTPPRLLALMRGRGRISARPGRARPRSPRRSEGQQDPADGVAVGDHFHALAELREGEGGVDLRLDLAGRPPGHQLLDPGAVVAGPALAFVLHAPADVLAHVEAGHVNVLQQQDVGGDRGNAAPHEADHDVAPAHVQAAQRVVEHLLAHGVVDDVHAAAVGGLGHIVAEGGRGRVDHMLDPALAQELGLGLAPDHGEGLGSHGAGDVDRGQADAAAGAVDQHLLSGL